MSLDINPYSLNRILVASTNADASSYGDPVSLAKDQMFTITPQHDTDEQRDSGAIVSGLSVPTHGELEIQAGGIPFEVILIMTGASSSTSNSIVTIRPKTAVLRPYWGAIGVAPTEDGRYIAIGLYKCQLSADAAINLSGETNEYITQEMSARAFAKQLADNSYQFMLPKIYDDLAALDADIPTDGTEMLAWLS